MQTTRDEADFERLAASLVLPEKLSNVTGREKRPYQTLTRKQEKKAKLKTRPKKTLSRKEKRSLGLYTLPRSGMKYADMLPLHQLWTQYLREQLNLTDKNAEIPSILDPGYERFGQLLLKADYHGAKVTVSRSKCPSLVGAAGIVVMDTKGTFKVLGEDNKLRTIPKSDSVFQVHWAGLEFTVFGKHMATRPAERATKKLKSFMDLDLR